MGCLRGPVSGAANLQRTIKINESRLDKELDGLTVGTRRATPEGRGIFAETSKNREDITRRFIIPNKFCYLHGCKM